MQHQARLTSLLLGLTLVVAAAPAASAEDTPEARAPTPQPLPEPPPAVPMVNASDYLERVVAPHKGRVVVVNFWATWCAPCLKELPELQRAQAGFPKDKVDVVLVSADFGEHAPKNILKTLAKLKVPYPSFLQKAGDPQDLIDLVDPSWQGDLPYTIVYDAEGVARAKLPGAQDEATFTKAIEAALSPSSPPSLKPR